MSDSSHADERPARGARTLAALAAAVLSAGLFWSVAEMHQGEKEIGAPGRPIVFVLSPDHGRRLTEDDRHALEAMLERESGLRVEISIAPTPLDAIEAFGSRGDVGLLNLFEYILARREYGVEAALRVLRAGRRDGYHGVLLVRSDGPIRTLADLSRKRVAYVDPHSSSGFVFPAQRIAKAGVWVIPTFTGSHEAALSRLLSGEADAAAVYEELSRDAANVRVLDRTETIPSEPIFFRTGLRAQQRERIVQAFRRIAADPASAARLSLLADIVDFEPATDGDYDAVLPAIRSAGASIYEVVPEGLRIEARRRGIEYIP